MNTAPADGVNGSEETLKRKGRRRIGCWTMGCATPIGLVVLLVVVLFAWRASSVAAVEQLEAEIVARGEPLNVEEVGRRYFHLGGLENKTALYKPLIAKLADEQLRADSIPLPIIGVAEHPEFDPTTPWEFEQQVADFLAKHTPLIDGIEAAAMAEGEVRFPRDFSQSVLMQTEELQFFREAARFLDLRARYAIHVGDSDQAFRSILAMLNLSDDLHAEPLPSDHLVRVAIHGVTTNLIAHCLPFQKWNESQINQLLNACQAVDWQRELSLSVARERALSRSIFNDLSLRSRLVSDVPAVNRFEDERFYLESLNRCLEATDLPFPECLAELRRTDHLYVDQIENGSAIDEMVYEVSFKLLSFSTNYAHSIACARAQAIDEATACQLAIELYRREQGKPPTTLSDLGPAYFPAEPIDPFNGRLLAYVINDKDLIVYSAGVTSFLTDPDVDNDGYPLHYTVRVRLE